MAAGDLTTVSAVKQFLGLTSATDDALLARMVTAYSALAQTYMSRQIAIDTYTEKRSGHGGVVMACTAAPLVTVSAVTINGQSIPASSSFGQAGYTFDDRFIYLYGYCFARGGNNVQLAYSAGFAVVPPEIEEAVIQTISIRYKERDRIGLNSKSLAGESISYMIKDFPATALTTLQNYKKVIPV